jgi:hypothetical protein
MKILLPSVALALALACLLGRAVAADPSAPQTLSPEQIEELVSPIALYPDPLIALILPASTFPSDLVLAARFLDRGGSPDATASEPWDESVRSLTRYREVIDYLDDHLEWTRRLGNCFMEQPDDVMDAIQMVRVRARAAGFLTDTPEQRVIVESDEICIVPAQPTVIYVPRYDPWVICRPSPAYYSRGPFITFGVGWGVGSWLSFDCDWRARSVRVIDRPAYWYRSPRWDDRDRYRSFAGTNWSRRTPYARHDERFERSPRVAAYEVPGKDHRDWSERRVDVRPNRDYHPNSNRYTNDSRDDRSREWQNRRRPETNGAPRISTDPIGTPVIPPVAPVIPPVATPLPQAPRPAHLYRSPENHPSPVAERTRPVDNARREPPRSSAPETVARSQPASSPAPVTRRVESRDNSDQRRQNDGNDSRSSSRGGGRYQDR